MSLTYNTAVKIRNPDKPELRVITKKLPGMYIYEKKIPQSDSSVTYLYSEWLLFNANSAIFQLYHGENKLIFNEMMMSSGLY